LFERHFLFSRNIWYFAHRYLKQIFCTQKFFN